MYEKGKLKDKHILKNYEQIKIIGQILYVIKEDETYIRENGQLPSLNLNKFSSGPSHSDEQEAIRKRIREGLRKRFAKKG